jgi:hypothetical protein
MRDVWLKEEDVSKMTGLSRKYLSNCRWAGKGIPYSKVSARCIRYKEADVLRFMERGRVEVRDVR